MKQHFWVIKFDQSGSSKIEMETKIVRIVDQRTAELVTKNVKDRTIRNIISLLEPLLILVK